MQSIAISRVLIAAVLAVILTVVIAALAYAHARTGIAATHYFGIPARTR